MPELAKKCMKTWSEVWPDYEIVRWDESNSPKNQYVEKTLKMRKFANTSNLVRLYAVLSGGIYLDVDMEAYRGFDSLLCEKMFAGWQDSRYVNNAVIGSIPNHPFIEFCIREFLERFDGSELAHISSPLFMTDMLRRYCNTELKAEQTERLQNNITLLSNDYFYPHPYEVEPLPEHITNKTVAMHRWMKSWG